MSLFFGTHAVEAFGKAGLCLKGCRLSSELAVKQGTRDSQQCKWGIGGQFG
jgi:hypothetical protein